MRPRFAFRFPPEQLPSVCGFLDRFMPRSRPVSRRYWSSKNTIIIYCYTMLGRKTGKITGEGVSSKRKSMMCCPPPEKFRAGDVVITRSNRSYYTIIFIFICYINGLTLPDPGPVTLSIRSSSGPSGPVVILVCDSQASWLSLQDRSNTL
jgi:hypothetical protein